MNKDEISLRWRAPLHPPVTLLEVEPARSNPLTIIREDGSTETTGISFQVYPESPRGKLLRRLLDEACVSDGDFARVLGIDERNLVRLECGSVTLSDEDWTRAIAQLAPVMA